MVDPRQIQLHLLPSVPTEEQIRGLFVALTGRAPTAEEIADAQADADPDA